MRNLRNEITYAIACACEGCQKKSGRDFEIIGCLHASLQEARKELRRARTIHDTLVFLVRETIEPLYQIPQRDPKRKVA